MKLKIRLISLFLIFCFVFSLTGCSDTKDAYIYFELPATPLTLDPQVASSDSELLIIRNIYEGLLRKDSKGKIVCGVAESYEKNGLVYTFNIKEDARWHNGDSLDAKDFVFAFKRAVDPKTKSPFASRLFCIKNAEQINKGVLSTDNLGVKAIDSKTLEITLAYESELFEETLTSSVAMPCNEEFFYSSSGKYGLLTKAIFCNGSYRITRWRKDPFGIRLYRWDEYVGDFKAENAAVFITCDEEPAIEELEKGSVDMAFIDSSLTDTAHSLSLKTNNLENICWVLTLGNDFSADMRKALSLLIDSSVYSESIKTGYSTADSLFPAVLDRNSETLEPHKYDPAIAKQLYLKEIKKLENGQFPTDIVLYYYDDLNVKDVVTDIVGHWQGNLSAFVNIEAVSSPDLLISQLSEQSYAMSLFPVRADSADLNEYLKKFGVTQKGITLNDTQNSILKSDNIIPILFQNTVIAYAPDLSEVITEPSNGYIDFSFIIKED